MYPPGTVDMPWHSLHRNVALASQKCLLCLPPESLMLLPHPKVLPCLLQGMTEKVFDIAIGKSLCSTESLHMGATKVGALVISQMTRDFSVTNMAHAAAMRLSQACWREE